MHLFVEYFVLVYVHNLTNYGHLTVRRNVIYDIFGNDIGYLCDAT
jgi:hypothetical protein